jgi:hypothetical protein
MVFQSAPTTQLAKLFPSKDPSKAPTICDIERKDRLDAGSAILLFPPYGRLKWTIGRMLLAVRLWVKDKFSPVPDKGADEGVS